MLDWSRLINGYMFFFWCVCLCVCVESGNGLYVVITDGDMYA